MALSTKDGAGLICKTIIFAVSKKHANRLREVSEEMFPQHVKRNQAVFKNSKLCGTGLIGTDL